MPNNKKPQGGRTGRNFEPRYGEKKTSFHDRHAGRPEGDRGGRSDAGPKRSAGGPSRSFDRSPGSKSSTHRGYRPAEADTGAPKRRWTDQERAGRDDARGFAGRSDSGRRDAPQRDERPRTGSDRGNDRPRFNNDRGGERPRYNNDRGNDRPRFNSDRGAERPSYNADRGAGRPSYNADRSAGRPSYNNDRGNDRPRFNNDRSAGRPSYNNDRGAERPRFNDDRSAGRPSYNADRGAGRPSYNNDRGNDRPRFNNDRSAGRPSYNNDRGAERPSYNNDRSAGRPSYNNDRGAERPRYNADRGNDRPRFNSDRGAERPSYNDRPRTNSDDRRAERPRVNAERSNDRPRTNDRERSNDRPRTNDRERSNDRPRTNDRERRSEQRPGRDNWNASTSSGSSGAKFTPGADVVHERLAAKTVAAPEVDGTTFADLGLGSNIVEALKELGASAPFAIQAATIPSILEGRDVLGRGRTGSGKTIAFGAPLVERVLKSQAGKRREFGRSPRAIILAPTRELALQLDRTIQPIARSVGLFTTQIYGGVPQGRQVGALKKGVDIVIGTPGRVEDLINQGKLDLSDCIVAVLDEADHMCELGFVEPVQRILRHTKDGSQKLLFSATLDREVAALVDEFLVDPAVYEVAGEDQDSGTIEHRVLVIEHREKADILTSMVDRAGKTLVFARTRAYAETLAEQFDDAGISAVSLHGDLNQAKRTRNLERMSSGRVQVLVATDVAARGIHVDDIDLVIQADAPDEYKTYMHRSGRTGRAGRAGRVVTLITRQRERRMTDLLGRAEIDAPFESARLGDDVIEEITGRMPTNAEITA
ncbi:DEAD/DEAH box helicase [Microbacterium sp. A93]|uniref:DEAD/DEAH box helicase n=1 Tax=Microbacterium sp. A93 TaxID=3450716 RepID=UPI003F42AC58